MGSSELTFRFDQTNLDALCCEDEQQLLKETHRTNSYYGKTSILKRYARLPLSYKLKAMLEHSLIIYDEVAKEDCEALVPVNLCCSPHRAAVVAKETGRPSYPVGYSFLYAIPLYHRLFGPTCKPRKGTIVFPFKSTKSVHTRFDHEDYAQRLLNLPDEMKPVVVCLYWADHVRGVTESYTKYGLRVVTAGHRYHQDFLLRFYDICHQFKYAVSNGFATHLFLAVGSGCSFSYLDSTPVSRTDHLGRSYEYTRPAYFENREESYRLFSDFSDQITPEQQTYVDRILGTECVKTPQELRRLLLSFELRDKLLPIPESPACRAARLPPFVLRKSRHAARLTRSLKKRLGVGHSEPELARSQSR